MSRFNSGKSTGSELNKVRINKEHLRKSLFLFKYLLPYKYRFIAALLLLSLGSGLSLAFPWLFGNLIDLASGKGSEYFPTINYLIAAVALLLIVSAFISFFRIMWFAETGERALADLRIDLFSHVLHLPKAFFDQNTSGDLMSRLNNDLSQIQDTLSTFLANILRQSIILIAGISIVLFTHTQLALLMLGMIPFVVGFALVFGKKIRSIAKNTQNEMAVANSVAEESFTGIVSVKTNTRELFESNRYGGSLHSVVQLAIKNSRYRGAFAASVVLMMFGAILGVLWYGTTLIERGELSLGDLNSFIFYGMFIAGSMAGFAENYNQLQKTLGATERIGEIFEHPKEQDGIHTPPQLVGHVRFTEIHFSYPSRPDMLAINGVSFEIKPGEKLALVGASGSGKSTIAALLQRLYDPDSGTILIDQTPLKQFGLSALRRHIAYVSQDIVLFSGTIAENIGYGKEAATENEIIEAAKQANAMEFIERFPEGLKTMVGERGMQLSGGQRQRIAIARAFLRNPSILILDEATSALDAASESEVQKALESIMEGRTSLIIAHRLSTIRFADHVLVLDAGKVIEFGTHEELVDLKNGAYRKLLSLQMHNN